MILENEIALGGSPVTAYQIERSLRFNSADSAYLSWTPPQAGNRRTWTWSGWVKRANLSSYQEVFSANNNNSTAFDLAFNGDVLGCYLGLGPNLVTTQVFRDPSAWYHIVCAVDTTQATASNRIKLYVNGVQVSSFSSANYPSQNFEYDVNNTTSHGIGRQGGSASNYLNAYITEINFIDGQALTPSDFGETASATGVWIPKAYTGSYGQNGFYLPFNDNSTVLNLGRNRQTLTADPYFPYTTLLLNGNQPSGVTDTNNNVFKDSSSNNFTITRSGATNNTTQGTFSPFSQTGWSTYFSGSPYLETPSNAAFSWGTGDFSMEFQVYVTTGGVLNRCLHFSDDISNLAIDSSNRIELWIGSAFNSGSYTVTPNTWAHVVATRVGSTLRLFLNGMLVATTTNSFNKGTGSLQIGGSAAYTNDLNGYLSGVRLVKGGVPTAYATSSTTVGTQIFTPPTAAFTGSESLTAGSVSFLGLQQNRWIDLSANAFAITVNGTPSVQPFSPFTPTAAYSAATNGGSGYFDGSGDYLSIANNTALQMGTGDFQVEAWVYVTNSSAFQAIICIGVSTGGSTAGTFTLRVQSDLKVRWCINDNSTGVTSTNAITANAWVHVCASRVSGTTRIFINGVDNGSLADSNNYNNTSGTMIGAENQGGATNNFYGYISGLRVVKGSGVTSVTVPTSPPTAITNTQLLANYTNAGITDATAKNVLETVSNVQVSTTQSKFGGSSMWFQAGGTLAMANNPGLSFGTGDFTVEWWVYWNTVPSASVGFVSGAGSGSTDIRYDGTDLRLGRFLVAFDSTFAWTAVTGQWYHVAVTRQGTSVRAFVNGTQIGTTSTNSNTYNAVGNFYIGTVTFGTAGDTPLAYIDDFRITKGLARYTGNFTVPAAQFAYNQADINVKQWVPNNFSVTAGVGNDSLVDSPTNYGTDTGAGGEVRGNYATFNSLVAAGGTFTNGNLDFTAADNGLLTPTTVFPSSGKWYCEIVWNSGVNPRIGVTNTAGVGNNLGSTANSWAYLYDGRLFNNNTVGNNTGVSATTGDVVMLALDLDAGKLWYGKNGTWMPPTTGGTNGNPAAGTNATQTFTANQVMSFAVSSGGGTPAWTANFGQRPFAYPAPSGFKALCTQNLPTPAIGASASTLASKNMNVVTYTGDGTNNRSITGVGFQPDLVWIKSRSNAYDHQLVDAVRGAGKELYSNLTNAESTLNTVPAFVSDGFQVNGGTYAGTNGNGATFVGWSWKANGAGVSNTAGSITSTVSANQTAGISIATFAAPSSGTATIGHGLGVAPTMIIVKSRAATYDWIVYHGSLGNTNAMRLNLAAAVNTSSIWWNNTSPTSSVFTLGSAYNGGGNSVAYCFAEIAGFSKFGSYTGNGNADGPFVYCGFRPRWVLIKQSSGGGGNWILMDSARSPYNVIGDFLLPNVSNAEGSSSASNIDFTSNGFKVRNSNADRNASGETYIFMAFAEFPFQYARAR